ncbi:decapping nuclease DXO homolog [Musca vetustissima]|uniref:decapping nuclease DXO homolog n=1 Tax=Musca vetustissima TaxID=27455 RepID=UPI002AB6F006|nr:decapping nuclease DXO homolog [Musca vetustissima]
MATGENKNLLMKVEGHHPLNFEKYKDIMETPKIVGFYSYDYNKFEPSKYIKYFKEPKSSSYPLNLNGGEWIPCQNGQSDTRLHIPLTYAMTIDDSINQPNVKTTNVYTGRRVLTQLMEYCYSIHDDTIFVTRHNGNLYMTSLVYRHTPPHMHHKRLEQLLFTDSPDEEPQPDKPIDFNKTLSCLHRTNMGKFSIFYAGDVQGIISDKKLDNLNDMDMLNQCRFVFTKQLWTTQKKEHILQRYWVQSRLSNIDDIYIAYKDCSGVVNNPIEHLKTSELPEVYNNFKPEICFGFLYEFLENVENLMSNVNSLDTVYEFNLKPKEKTVIYKIHEGKTDNTFIPKYYAEFVNKANK